MKLKTIKVIGKKCFWIKKCWVHMILNLNSYFTQIWKCESGTHTCQFYPGVWCGVEGGQLDLQEIYNSMGGGGLWGCRKHLIQLFIIGLEYCLLQLDGHWMIILCERVTTLEWTCCKIVWDKADLLCVCV